MALKETSVATWQEFLGVLTKRRLRLVKLRDEGFTRAERKGKQLVSQPKVRIVATAFDPRQHVLYRWEETMDAKKSVIVTVTENGSSYPRVSSRHKTELLRLALEAREINVGEGEWTLEELEAVAP